MTKKARRLTQKARGLRTWLKNRMVPKKYTRIGMGHKFTPSVLKMCEVEFSKEFFKIAMKYKSLVNKEYGNLENIRPRSLRRRECQK